MRAALYIRVSTDQQVERGDSLEVQQERLEAYVRSKGWEIQGHYTDRGVSARDTNRPAFQKLLGQLKAGQIDVVLVTKLDRAFRDTRDFLENTELFEERGVRFACLDGDIDTTTPSGRVFSTIRAALAQFERETTAERVREVMLARAQKGLWNGGVVPFGFRRVPETKKLALDPAEAHVIRRIFELFLETRSIRGVVHRLNTSGQRTRAGLLWATTSIRRILTNPVYYGAQTYNKRRAKGKTSTPRPGEQHVIIPGVYEPIVSHEDFLHVQRLLAAETPRPSARRSAYLLTGLVFCGKCGSRMYGYTYRHHQRQEKLYRYYRCWGHTAKGSALCAGNSIDLRYLEDVIAAELANVSLDPTRLQARLEEVAREAGEELKPLQAEQRRLREELGRVVTKRNRLVELFEDDLIGKEEFAGRRAELERMGEGLETTLREVTESLKRTTVGTVDLDASLKALRDLAAVYQELDPEERRTLLRTVVSRIVVGERNIRYGLYLIPECMGARAATPPTPPRSARARRCRSSATWRASPGRCWTGSTSTWTCPRSSGASSPMSPRVSPPRSSASGCAARARPSKSASAAARSTATPT